MSHGGHRSGERELFHGTIPHDDQLLQFGGLVFHHHVDLRTVVDSLRDTPVTDIAERERRIGSDYQRIGAVGTGGRAVRTAHDDGHADERLSLPVADGSGQAVFPGSRRGFGPGAGLAAQKDPVGTLHPVVDAGAGENPAENVLDVSFESPGSVRARFDQFERIRKFNAGLFRDLRQDVGERLLFRRDVHDDPLSRRREDHKQEQRRRQHCPQPPDTVSNRQQRTRRALAGDVRNVIHIVRF